MSRKTSWYKKIAVLAIAPLLIFALLAPAISLAQQQGPPQGPQAGPPPQAPPPPAQPGPAPQTPEEVEGASCVPFPGYFSAAGCVSWVLSILLNILFFIVSLFVALAALLIEILIDLNQKVLASPIVTEGFRITLGLANLGFVLSLIIIAFATILRMEQYGTKKLIRNLIIAAILVNFSLAIAGLLIDFTGVLSKFFLSQVTAGKLSDFTANMTAAFQASGFLNVKDTGTFGLLEFGSAILNFVFSLFLAAVFSMIVAIVFFALGIMLLTRYIYLIALLVLMPLAWLFWVTPQLTYLWTRWWRTFLRWVFFLPASLFFIFLALKGASNIGQLIRSTGSASPAAQAINQNILQEGGAGMFLSAFVFAGFLIASLVVANQMGIAGAGIGMRGVGMVKNWAIGRVKGVGIFAGRKATAPLRYKRKPEGKSLVERTADLAERARKIPLVGRALGYAAGGAVKGMAALSRAGEAGAIKAAEEKVKKMNDQQKRIALLTAGEPLKIAILNDLAKNKKLDQIDLTRVINDKTRRQFLKYDMGKQFSDMEKTAGFNVEVLKAETPEERQKAMDKFIETYTMKDYDKLQGDILGKKPAFGFNEERHNEMRNLITRSIFDKHPGAISKMRTKLKSDTLGLLQQDLNKYIKEFEKSQLPDEARGPDVPVKEKLKAVREKKPEAVAWTMGLYNAQRNLGGSLFGGGGPAPREAPEAPETGTS